MILNIDKQKINTLDDLKEVTKNKLSIKVEFVTENITDGNILLNILKKEIMPISVIDDLKNAIVDNKPYTYFFSYLIKNNNIDSLINECKKMKINLN